MNRDQVTQIANGIKLVATGNQDKFLSEEIERCKGIIQAKNCATGVFTGKISALLNQLKIRHEESDLVAIANLIREGGEVKEGITINRRK